MVRVPGMLLQVEHEVSFCTEGSQCFVRGLEDEVCRICVCSWVEFLLLLGAHYPAWGILGLLYPRACPGRLADFGLAERLDLGVREAGPVRHAGGIDKRQLVIENLNFFEVSNLACARHPDLGTPGRHHKRPWRR